MPLEDLTQWLTEVPDNVNPACLSIPGTHDSCAWVDPGLIPEGAWKTQNLNIYDQLQRGIRFLDIRLDNQLNCCHGPIDLNHNLDCVQTAVQLFLLRHPNEAVFMSIKHESGDAVDFDQQVLNHIEEQNWYIGHGLPNNMADIRGRIILLRRFPITTPGLDPFGVNLFNGWPENGDAIIQNVSATAVNQITVQDCYNTHCWHLATTVADKLEYIERNVNQSINERFNNHWYINFLSHQMITGTTNGIRAVSDAVLPRTVELLVDRNNYRGIFPMDYCDTNPGLINTLIQNNYPFPF